MTRTTFRTFTISGDQSRPVRCATASGGPQWRNGQIHRGTSCFMLGPTNRVPSLDGVRCCICRTSSSANVPLTCERCGDSAWRLSCVYGGPWKRAFRVNTRVVHFAVSHRRDRSAGRFVYICFTVAIISAVWLIYPCMFLFCIIVLIFQSC